jgi:hypothetical protein
MPISKLPEQPAAENEAAAIGSAPDERMGHSPFPILGIGASAGGLEAFPARGDRAPPRPDRRTPPPPDSSTTAELAEAKDEFRKCLMAVRANGGWSILPGTATERDPAPAHALIVSADHGHGNLEGS